MPHVTPLHAGDPRQVGRYQLAGRIAGMPASGPVYLARSADGSEVTITVLGGDWAPDSAARDRFAAEARSARRVTPFCAARLLDVGLDDGGQAFLVSEHVAGPSLLEVVADDGERDGADLEMLAIGAATGLAAIHQAGLVHGAFGPEYLILGSHGPRVVDFGITPPYGAATPSADMLAWAQTVVFAATGRPPSSREDLDALPPLLGQVVTDCLSGEPADRPAARSVLRELLGDDDPPAGLLAEGSRRAAGAASQGPAAEAASPGTAGGAASQGPGAVAGGRRQVNQRSGAQRSGAQRSGAQPQRPGPGWRRRRGASILWAAGAIVAVLAAVILVHLMQNDGRPTGNARPPATGSGTDRAASRDVSPSATPSLSASPPSPQTAATIPAALAGAWSGQVRQGGPADVFNAKVSLAGGGNSGTISYAGASFVCTGDLSLVSSAAGTITLSQQIVSGQKTCANGVVTLRPGTSSGTVLFVFRGAAGPQARGTLQAGQ